MRRWLWLLCFIWAKYTKTLRLSSTPTSILPPGPSPLPRGWRRAGFLLPGGRGCAPLLSAQAEQLSCWVQALPSAFPPGRRLQPSSLIPPGAGHFSQGSGHPERGLQGATGSLLFCPSGTVSAPGVGAIVPCGLPEVAVGRAAQRQPPRKEAAGTHPREKGGGGRFPAHVGVLPLPPARNKFWEDIPEKRAAELGWVGCLEYMVAL